MRPSDGYLSCWHNSITYATSIDGGQTYTHAPAPAHRVANIPYEYVPHTGPARIFEPGNITHNSRDGYYYSLLHLVPYHDKEAGTGIMHTETLDDPGSWRCWDGAGFNATFLDPYTETGYDPADHVCAPISKDKIDRLFDSLTFNTYLDKYLLVGPSSVYDHDRGALLHGYYFSLSDDLINWTTRRLLMEIPLLLTHCSDVDRAEHVSLIDPDNLSRNFEYADRDAYLYYNRLHGGTIYDQDLVRIPIRFTLDSDLDGIEETEDNRPAVYNPGQEDTDDDGTGDACD